MKSIGIIGGVGPYAGLDLNRKIFRLTKRVHTDQDYPAVFLLSLPQIPDRSTYLLDPEVDRDPAPAIISAFTMLETLQCTACGIPCNTAHAPPILDKILSVTRQYRVQFIHMIRETAHYLGKNKAGLLATMGTYTSEVYEKEAMSFSLRMITPENTERRQRVHNSVYSLEFGIKAFSDPIKPAAISILQSEGEALIAQGAEVIVLGCTEISLCAPFLRFSVPMVDPMEILAGALLRVVFPEKL